MLKFKKNYYFLLVTTLVIFNILLISMTAGRNYIFSHLNSDNSIYALMAKDLIKDGKLNIFFYGQNYMGPLTSIMIAISQFVLNFFGVKYLVPHFETEYIIDPISITLGSSMLQIFGALLFSEGIRNKFGMKSAIITLVSCLFGTAAVFSHNYLPNGPEIQLFCIGLLIYLFSKDVHKFFLGLALGFSWWMNQSVVFAVIPLLVFMVRNDIKLEVLKNKMFSKETIRKNKAMVVFLLLVILMGIIANEIGYFEFNSVIKFKSRSGTKAIFFPILFYVLYVFTQCFESRIELYKYIKENLLEFRYFLIGSVLGYLPVIIGVKLNWYENSYTPKFELVKISSLPGYLMKLITDYYPKVFGFNFSYLLGTIVFVVTILIVSKNILNIWKQKIHKIDWKDLLSIGFLINVMFVVLSQRSQSEYASRYSFYLIYITPLLLYLAENKWIKRISLIILLVYIINVSSFVKEITINIDTTTEIKNLKESGYKICYADFWDAYRLEYLTDGNVEFIVHNSQDRSKIINNKRRKRIEDKCYYDKKTKKISRFDNNKI